MLNADEFLICIFKCLYRETFPTFPIIGNAKNVDAILNSHRQ